MHRQARWNPLINTSAPVAALLMALMLFGCGPSAEHPGDGAAQGESRASSGSDEGTPRLVPQSGVNPATTPDSTPDSTTSSKSTNASPGTNDKRSPENNDVSKQDPESKTRLSPAPEPEGPSAYAGKSELLVVPPPALDDTNPQSGWPVFRGDANASGIARTTLPPSDQLRVLWKHKVKRGEFQSTPCLVSLEGRPVVVIGDMDGLVLAIDLHSGDVLWTYRIKFGFVCSVAYHNDRFYVGNIDGRFLCLDSQGRLQWEFQAGMEIDGSATFFQNLVLFTSQDAKLYALDSTSGELAWSLEAGDQLRCAPTVVEGRAFLAGCDAVLHIIQLSDQSEEPGVEIDSPTGCTPAALGDWIFFGSEQSGMIAVDWRGKRTMWTFNDNGAVVSVRGNAAVTPDAVIFGDTNRQVHALDPETGTKKWSTPLKGGVESSPVIVGDRVFVTAMDGRLYALNASTGEIEWNMEFQGQFKSSPAVGFSRIVIASDDGVIYCLGRAPR